MGEACKSEVPTMAGANRKLRMCVFLLAAPLFFCGCGKSVLTGGPVDGVVLESSTLAPVPDAMVIGKWKGILPTIHSNSIPCYHVELAFTDGQGKFRLPAWTLHTKGHQEWMAYINQTDPVDVVVYKPGYMMPQRHQDDPARVLVDPFIGNRRANGLST